MIEQIALYDRLDYKVGRRAEIEQAIFAKGINGIVDLQVRPSYPYTLYWSYI